MLPAAAGQIGRVGRPRAGLSSRGPESRRRVFRCVRGRKQPIPSETVKERWFAGDQSIAKPVAGTSTEQSAALNGTQMTQWTKVQVSKGLRNNTVFYIVKIIFLIGIIKATVGLRG